MSILKSFQINFNLTADTTIIDSIKIFEKGEIAYQDFEMLTKWLQSFKKNFLEEEKCFNDILKDKQEGYKKMMNTTSSCCKVVLNNYICSKHHVIKTYNPFNENNLSNHINFMNQYEGCHKAFYEQLTYINEKYHFDLYNNAKNYFYTFESYIRRCLGYCHTCVKHNSRFSPLKPFKDIFFIKELFDHYNFLNSMSQNPIYKEIDDYFHENLILKITNKDYINENTIKDNVKPLYLKF